MIHARAPRLAAILVAASVVALSTSACGGTMQAGAAAVVGGQRITDAQIQDRVAAVNALAKDNGSTFPALLAPNAELATVQVNQVVEAAVWQRAAADLGVKVGPDDVSAAKKALVDSARSAFPTFQGSDDQLVAMADIRSGQPSGVAPDGVDSYIAVNTYQQAVITQEAKRLNADPNTTEGVNALRADIFPALNKAAGELNLKISPRYGTWNTAKASIMATTPAWIRAAQPAPVAAMDNS